MRSEALDDISRMLEDGSLPPGGAAQLVAALHERLFDSNWSVIEKCLLLIRTLVSECDDDVRCTALRLFVECRDVPIRFPPFGVVWHESATSEPLKYHVASEARFSGAKLANQGK
eukprot:2738695-Pleurochrysis_carterae.AAC.3